MRSVLRSVMRCATILPGLLAQDSQRLRLPRSRPHIFLPDAGTTLVIDPQNLLPAQENPFPALVVRPVLDY